MVAPRVCVVAVHMEQRKGGPDVTHEAAETNTDKSSAASRLLKIIELSRSFV